MIGAVIARRLHVSCNGMPAVGAMACGNRPRAVLTTLAGDDASDKRAFFSEAGGDLPTDDAFVIKAVAVEDIRRRTAAAAA